MSLRRLGTTLALLALSAAPAAAQSRPRIFDGSFLPSFSRLRTVMAKHLLIPVQGVTADRLSDSFLDGRSGGRTHYAIDIHAPRGTPVLAVADGTILKIHGGGIGGNALYHLDSDGITRYYYAHLDHYADGLHVGQAVSKGQVLAYVGDTGNAAPGDYHLHFSVAILNDMHRWWQGENLNPYLILRESGTATSARDVSSLAPMMAAAPARREAATKSAPSAEDARAALATHMARACRTGHRGSDACAEARAAVRRADRKADEENAARAGLAARVKHACRTGHTRSDACSEARTAVRRADEKRTESSAPAADARVALAARVERACRTGHTRSDACATARTALRRADAKRRAA
ncbi:MAG TPA: M23 family metallopeptidase, partial [Longimicrobiaceae bacterium]|nr:M23 family metallopeptidase [Longimicrobiaceae bacterium]